MFFELAKIPDSPPDFEKVSEICGKHGISFVQIFMSTIYKSNSGSSCNLTVCCFNYVNC